MQQSDNHIKLNLVNKDVKAIMGKPLPLLLRWGNILLLALLLLIAAAGLIIRHPRFSRGILVIDQDKPVIILNGSHDIIKPGQMVVITKQNPAGAMAKQWDAYTQSYPYQNARGLYQVDIDAVPAANLVNETVLIKTGSISCLKTIFR